MAIENTYDELCDVMIVFSVPSAPLCTQERWTLVYRGEQFRVSRLAYRDRMND